MFPSNSQLFVQLFSNYFSNYCPTSFQLVSNHFAIIFLGPIISQLCSIVFQLLSNYFPIVFRLCFQIFSQLCVQWFPKHSSNCFILFLTIFQLWFELSFRIFSRQCVFLPTQVGDPVEQRGPCKVIGALWIHLIVWIYRIFVNRSILFCETIRFVGYLWIHLIFVNWPDFGINSSDLGGLR